MIAPALFIRKTTSASSFGTKSLNCRKPQVVGSLAISTPSLNVIGMPSTGRRSPPFRASSTAFAAFAHTLEVANDDRVEAPFECFNPSVFDRLGSRNSRRQRK
jgi:hypothetical protein